MFIASKVVEPRHPVAASDRPVRSLAKAVSWRVTGSIDTMLLSWLFTADLSIAAAIGLTEVLTKMVLYYGHERVWNRIPLGRCALPDRSGMEPVAARERPAPTASSGLPSAAIRLPPA